MKNTSTNPIALWSNGSESDLTISLADTDAPHGAVLVCPGGGYRMLATGHEGHDMLAAFNEAGFDAAMLRYRLGPDHRHPDMIHDAMRGMRLFRQALDLAGRLSKCAVLGFSAGGHLAATLTVHPETFACAQDDLADKFSARPDAAVLCYAVVNMVGDEAERGSRLNLIGQDPDAELTRQLSPQLHVNADTPPTFLWHTYADGSVDVEHSLGFAQACRREGVPCEMHLYERGPHGVGLAPGYPELATWFPLATAFLQRHFS